MKTSAHPVSLAALLLLALLFLACEEDPTGQAGQAHIIIGFSPAAGGSFTARLNGQTFSSSGGHPVVLNSLGTTYEVSGSFTGNGLGIHFASNTQAGVESGSLVSLAGPSPIFSACDMSYFSSASGSQQFRLQFRVTGTTALVCP